MCQHHRTCPLTSSRRQPRLTQHKSQATLLMFCVSMVLLLLLGVVNVRGMSLAAVQKVLDLKKNVDFTHAKDKSLLVTLSAPTRNSYRFAVHFANFSKFTYFTVTSCIAPVQYVFSKHTLKYSEYRGRWKMELPNIVEKHITSIGWQHGIERTKFMTLVHSSGQLHHRLDTEGNNVVDITFNTNRRHLGFPNKALIRASESDNTADFGFSRYNQRICTYSDKTQDEMTVIINIHSIYRKLDKICVVVNKRRPLPQYCSAQIALGNQLPFPRDGLLTGVEFLQLKHDEFAFECVNFTGGYRIMPSVNIKKLLASRPDKLYINTYLLEKEREDQANAFAWDTVTYYNRGPIESCTAVLDRSGEGPVAILDRSRTEPGTLRGIATTAINQRHGSRSSVFVRLRQLNLLNSGYEVRLTPYTSVSDSFAHGNLTCVERLWSTGVTPCDVVVECDVQKDHKCKYDRFRVEIIAENKKDPRRNTSYYYGDEDLLLGLRSFEWWSYSASEKERELVQPQIGRPDAVLDLLKSFYDKAVFNKEKTKVKRYKKLLNACKATFDPNKTQRKYRRVERKASKCYIGLLGMHLEYSTVCSVKVKISSPQSSRYTAQYNPTYNRYDFIVYKIFVKQSKLLQINRTKRKKNKKGLTTKLKRQIEQRLLQTLPFGYLPTPHNQELHKRLFKLRHKRKRAAVRVNNDVIESLVRVTRRFDSFPNLNTREFSINFTQVNQLGDGSSRGEDEPQFLAIYVYASPLDRLAKGIHQPSLFGFRVQKYTLASWYKVCGAINVRSG